MALDLSTLNAEQQIAAIYIGYYDRAADPVGEDFWESAVNNPNLSLADIATDFSTQPETLIEYPFFDNPTAAGASSFISELYLNLFNRAPDAAGLTFWSDALEAAIDGTGGLSVGEIILAIIEGAQNSPEGNDLTTILNKIEVATAWTDAAAAAEIDYTTDANAQNSAKSIIEGVTDDQATVLSAKADIDAFFEPAGVPGNELFLTSGTDVSGQNGLDSTEDDDTFYAYIGQNPFVGGVSNTLASGDRLDGMGGNDRLYAEITNEFVGALGGGYYGGGIDIQPRIKNIEELDFEARDNGRDGGYFEGGDAPDVVVDAKHITDHEEIGSFYSDGDLRIENLTTLTNGGSARNTSEITVTMDHTDNFNSDRDASDLTVLFDNDYLLSGQESEGKVFYFLLDEDAELAGNPNRLNNIDVDGIRFTITNADGSTTDVTIEADAANTAGTHQGFVNALQPALQALIADGTLPAGTTLTLDPTVVDFTFLDDGSRSDEIPAIVLTTGDGSEVTATGFSRIEEEIGEYDVYGRFRSEFGVDDQPISVDLDLHKAGRGGEGGNVIIGGKSADGSDDTTADGIADGIDVINVNVKGAGNDDPNGGMTKPSNVGTITSTGNSLRQVIIATDPMFASGDTFASLTVRNGFDEDTTDDEETGDLELVNADAFLGDLTLGDLNANRDAGRITNADTITAQGGGDVTLGLLYDGTETAQAYSVTTGGGSDDVDVLLNGDALDYAGSSLYVSTGDGDDNINVVFDLSDDDTTNGSSEQLNQAILDGVEIDGGAGDDVINVDGVGKANIIGGAGNDVIYTDGTGTNAVWAFNFDAVRVSDGSDDAVGDFAPDELPGEQTSLAYIGGATVTVTLSGAGINVDPAAGGGVMSDGALGAVDGDDGYEASFTIEELINGNDFYGTQEDINAAVMMAINNDPVLSNLLSVSMGANNTLVVRSLTSGDFDETDLRIDIAQRDFGPAAADWDGVESEAQSVFSNSNITITNLGQTNVNGAANYDAADLTSSGTADAWYDGLSIEGGTNSTDGVTGEGVSNLHTAGAASQSETDNVIDGGAGDDLIVLSTDAVSAAGDVIGFSNSSNNALINGASNETIVLTGDNFGDDTIMNFQDGEYTAGDFSDDDVVLTPAVAEVFTVTFPDTDPNDDITGETLIFDGVTATSAAAAPTGVVIAQTFFNQYDGAAGTNYTASYTPGNDFITFTANTAGDQADVVPANFTGTAGVVPTVALVTDGADEVTGSTPDVAPGNPGIDFLDFGAYLTSEERVGGSSSSNSENLIDVTLDYGTDADAGEVGANEVVFVTYTDDTTNAGTFDSLSASDIAALFNNDANYDGTAFNQVNFDVVDNQGDNAVVNGLGKGILMVENAANDGEYKVFELTWDASAADGDENVTANELGSLDFGDTLTNFADVNLVGSDDYNNLIDNGFYA